MVIAVVEVQHAHHCFGAAAREAVTAKQADLPKVIARQTADVAVIVLPVPVRLAARVLGPREVSVLGSVATFGEREHPILVVGCFSSLSTHVRRNNVSQRDF